MRSGEGRAGAVRVEPAGLEALEAHSGPWPDCLLQSGFWGRHKRGFGWTALPFRCRWRGEAFPLLVLCRSLGGGLGLAYVPHGPVLEPPSSEWEEFLAELGCALRPHLPAGVLFLRFDPPWAREAGAALEPLEGGRGLRRAPMDIQPPATVVVDLQPPEQEILAQMKPKTRYNIRLALRKGVEVTEGSRRDLPAWYGLYRETARRDRIALHAFAYYDALFEAAQEAAAPALSSAPRLRLYLARHEGDLLAGIVVAQMGRTAWYLYGASCGRKRSLMPAYALQWQAMRQARADGCLRYDLFGIPPGDDPSHPMAGLYRFKTGFGGAILHRPGCHDLPYRPLAYRGYRLAEAGRRFWYGRVRKIRLRRPRPAAGETAVEGAV